MDNGAHMSTSNLVSHLYYDINALYLSQCGDSSRFCPTRLIHQLRVVFPLSLMPSRLVVTIVARFPPSLVAALNCRPV